jgi:L-ascorbate metabolism protein UlaG (beta-lactamase superfamily)
MTDPVPSPGGRCEITFIGTATTLMRFGEFMVLTDPNFIHRGQFVRVAPALMSRRRTEPALDIDDLPNLDSVVLSHLHGDHFDRAASRGLDRGLPVFTTPHAARRLRRKGFTESVPMRTWQEQTLEKGGARLRITSLPGRHANGPMAVLLPQVMGTLLEYEAPGREPLRIYITGDTLPHAELDGIAERFPDIDAAVVHLGGTRVLGMLLTMDGRLGVDLLNIVRPRTAFPVHYDDYGIFHSPLSEFTTEVRRREPATVVRCLERGRPYPLDGARVDTGRR